MSLSKNKVEKIIKKYSLRFTLGLNLCRMTITWIVGHSKDKALKRVNFEAFGTTSIASNAPKEAEIVIYYDQHTKEKEVVSTMIHELLHVTLDCLSRVVSPNSSKFKTMCNIEEKIVTDLEKFIVPLIKLKAKKIDGI